MMISAISRRNNRSIPYVISLRLLSSSDINTEIRNVQATELFRMSYYNTKYPNNTITMTDIDDLMIEKKCRPSLLIKISECSGIAFGIASKYMPEKTSKIFDEIIKDSVTQNLNDSIRTSKNNNDVIETIKFHRDIDFNNQQERSEDVNINDQDVKYFKDFMSQSLYNLLKISRHL